MCPPVSVAPANIGVYWSDEELFGYLLEHNTRGSQLPVNVLTNQNPYQSIPKTLSVLLKRPAQLFVTVNCHPHRNYDVGASLSNWSKNSYGYAVYAEDMWYYINSEQKKDTEHGFWKAKGEACEIFTYSDVAGWRTTLEFYEGQAPHGQKTDWVMQEYRLTWKSMCEGSKPKQSGSLCRVFSAGQSSNLAHHEQGGTDTAGESHPRSVPAAVPSAGNTSGDGSVSESQVMNRDNERGPLNVAEKVQNFLVENLHENDYLSRGDYLALDDLLDSEFHSSSSDNSSRLSLLSDEYFDSEALLRDLEDRANQDPRGEDANLNFSVSASVKPKEVVMCPATLGSLISGNGSKPPPERTLRLDYSLPGSAFQGKIPDKGVPRHATKSQKADHRSEGTPNSCNVASSSSSQKAVSEGKKKAVVARVKKPKRKYLCCFPF